MLQSGLIYGSPRGKVGLNFTISNRVSPVSKPLQNRHEQVAYLCLNSDHPPLSQATPIITSDTDYHKRHRCYNKRQTL
ncbi:hypothetical protein GBL98_18880 [Yersinia pseudotuberculosis]|nr:hypothetical protein EGX44_15145 [Yersinia pseudotuberculosis]MBO1609150.1 hypothetical protein [Yersinia pseudotuberculosis]MBO1613262.1 hypothetical protein [Yersinia pseudotuberculosis]MBO1623154.1 hypothetical protein [Yersinia pseudotuberculosis]